jgi:hypothetical protein
VGDVVNLGVVGFVDVWDVRERGQRLGRGVVAGGAIVLESGTDGVVVVYRGPEVRVEDIFDGQHVPDGPFDRGTQAFICREGRGGVRVEVPSDIDADFVDKCVCGRQFDPDVRSVVFPEFHARHDLDKAEKGDRDETLEIWRFGLDRCRVCAYDFGVPQRDRPECILETHEHLRP